jgi:hypothetical protein
MAEKERSEGPKTKGFAAGAQNPPLRNPGRPNMAFLMRRRKDSGRPSRPENRHREAPPLWRLRGWSPA